MGGPQDLRFEILATKGKRGAGLLPTNILMSQKITFFCLEYRLKIAKEYITGLQAFIPSKETMIYQNVYVY